MPGLDPNLPQDVRRGEDVPLYVAWFYLSIVFGPVWMLGVLTAGFRQAHGRVISGR